MIAVWASETFLDVQGWWRAAEEQLQRQQAELLAVRNRTATKPLRDAGSSCSDSSNDGSRRILPAKHADAVVGAPTDSNLPYV